MTNIKRPKVGLGIILLDLVSSKVLLGKRKGSLEEGMWGFPGGHIEWFESFVECAAREMLEETGLIEKEHYVFPNENPVFATNDIFPEEKKHYITVYMRAHYYLGETEVKEPKKCEEWNWYNWKEMPEPISTPVKNVIEAGYKPFE